MKINKKLLNSLLYIAVVGFSMLLLAFVVSATWIGQGVKENCQDAQRYYKGDCVQALSAVLQDEHISYRTRNSAIWALGQLGDPRAWELLNSYYTGVIPPRESQDEGLSQYELKKAIHQVSGGLNISRWPWAGGSTTEVQYDRLILTDTVVIAQTGAAYYPLAKKIAENEGLEIVGGITEAMMSQPRYIILVAEPANLTQARLVNIGQVFKRLDTYPALGIISGGSLESAEALWQRKDEVEYGRSTLGTDVEKGQLVTEPTLFDISPGATAIQLLNKPNLIKALQQSDFIYWARHVSRNKWFWNTEEEDFGDGDKLLAEELPDLPPLVAYTPSCGSFQPWEEDSIAISFTDHGAAAYAGHIHSPSTNGFLMRRGRAVPGMYTWPGFPLGVLVQVQNRMTTRVTFNTPLFYLLGDPRLHQMAEAPYQVISDETGEDGVRTLHGKSSMSGYLPVKIEGGAAYTYVSITGLDAASESDPFFNNNLHTLDLGSDNYLLFYHAGGEFEINLAPQIPPLWLVSDTLLDALDYSWVALALAFSPFSLVLLAVLAVILYVKTRRQHIPLRRCNKVFLIVLVLAAMKLAYLLLRLHRYSVYASVAEYSPFDLVLGFCGSFAAAAGGLILILGAKKMIVKAAGFALAVLPQLALTALYLVMDSYVNLMFLTANPVPMAVYNNKAIILPSIVLALEIAIIFAVNKILAVNYVEENNA